MKCSYPRLFVLTVLFFGIVVHVLGSFNIQTGDASFFAHYTMFLADTIAFIGLFLRKKWGYWFAIGLFMYAVCSQLYWTVEAILKQYDMVLAQGFTALLCIFSLLFLAYYKQQFIDQRSLSKSSLRKNSS